jgi:hypothetical protein
MLLTQTNPESAEAKTTLMKSCVALYKELLLLENFAVMNFCGISKVGLFTHLLTRRVRRFVPWPHLR